MRKIFKRISIAAAAAVIAVSSAFFAGCDYEFTPLEGDVTGEVSSQGGFVVEIGEYVYFINGVESYSSDNTYGTPVKGSLMRIKTADIKAGNNTAETVIPSLMVAGDYTSGIYIYNGRVYYATPNTVGNTQGEVDNTVLSFRSANLNGSDVQEHLRVADNATVYRYTAVDDVVYIVYETDGTLTSYNTETGTGTTLAENVVEYVLNSTDRTNPYIYYTMTVTDRADSSSPLEYDNYNQIYRVRADATEAPYTYTWDQEYLDENNDGEAPYLNLGELVLDGIGKNDDVTQFNHDVEAENANCISYGYTYTLQAYNNGGIYFVRSSQLKPGSSVGSSGELYFLDETKLGSDDWNTVSGNSVYTGTEGSGELEVVASAADTSNASSSAIFYTDDDDTDNIRHHYLYVSGSEIHRVDVINDGNGTKAQIGEGGARSLRIASDASEATLMFIDSTSDDTYSYLYYTKSSDNGLTVERAVYNGDVENYRTLSAAGENNEPYKPVRVLDIEHASGWYNYEVVDGVVFYANAHTFGETAYTYVWTVDLTDADGALLNNEELETVNEYYDKITGDDGYLTNLSGDGNGKLSGMIEYYFYTGERTAVDENIAEAVENGKSETYLYSDEEKAAFDEFIKGEGDAADFKDGDGTLYTQLSYFTNMIGAMSEDDTESYHEYWRDVLQRYTVSEEDTGLPVWAWALIGVGIGVVVVGAGLAAFFIVRSRKKKAAERSYKTFMEVDTTDDRDVDVYAANDAAEESNVQELTAEEAAEAETPASPEESEEQAEEAEAEAEEQPAAAPGDQPEE